MITRDLTTRDQIAERPNPLPGLAQYAAEVIECVAGRIALYSPYVLTSGIDRQGDEEDETSQYCPYAELVA